MITKQELIEENKRLKKRIEDFIRQYLRFYNERK